MATVDLRAKCLQLGRTPLGRAPAVAVASLVAQHTLLLAARGAEGGAFPGPAHAASLIALSGEVLEVLARAGLVVEAEAVFWRSWDHGLMPQPLPLPLRMMVAGMCAAGRCAEAIHVCRELARLPGYDAFPATLGALLAVLRGAGAAALLGSAYELFAGSPRGLAALQGAMVAATVRAEHDEVATALLRDHVTVRLPRPLAEDEARSLLRVASPYTASSEFAVGGGTDPRGMNIRCRARQDPESVGSVHRMRPTGRSGPLAVDGHEVSS